MEELAVKRLPAYANRRNPSFRRTALPPGNLPAVYQHIDFINIIRIIRFTNFS